MTDKYEWVIGRQVTFQPVGADEETDRITGTVLDIRDDSPWPAEEHYRVVIEGAEKTYDVAKERVQLK